MGIYLDLKVGVDEFDTECGACKVDLYLSGLPGTEETNIICPNSYPDPDTCECKECINSGQCPANQCCVDA